MGRNLWYNKCYPYAVGISISPLGDEMLKSAGRRSLLRRGQHGFRFLEASMRFLKSRSFRITCLILFVIGLALGIWQGLAGQSPALVFLSDLFFSEFLIFLLYGIARLLGNMHALTFASYSFRFVHRIFRNQKVNGAESRDAYWKYRESRPKDPNAKGYLILAAVFLAVSLALIPFAVQR